MKSEPDAYSIDDLAREKNGAHWDGVRNYSARNNMKAMREGDLVLFYHSQTNPPGVVGIARVCKEAYPDHTAFDHKSKYYDAKSTPDAPRWEMVDIEFVERLPEPVSLPDLRADPKFEDMILLRHSRLSVQPVDRKHFARVLKLGGAKTKP